MEYLKVGKIVNTQGLKGEVRVISTTDFPQERYAKGATLTLFKDGKPAKELTVASHRLHKSFHLLSFEGHPSINDVEGYKDCLLMVHKVQQVPLEEDELYYHEIIGMEIFDDDQVLIGKVEEVLSPGANDVWVVKGDKGKVFYIPFIQPVVHTIDKIQKRAIIHRLEGLFDDEN